ncbi:MAG: class I SAM-dependent methyltransferase [Panacagrimonas sp.]
MSTDATENLSAHTQGIARYYTRRHLARKDLFGDQPFANYGYWTRPDLSIAQASEAMAALLAAAAGLSPSDRVLDVGCGYGACAVVYAERFAPAHITGIDVTPTRIDNGRDYVATRGLSEVIDLQLGDATRMAFDDASFDKLIAVECAFHFDTRRDFFGEAARVLKPDGVLALTDLIPRSGVDIETYLREENTLAVDIEMYNRANAYDRDVYAEYLGAAGFTDLRIESITEWTLARFIPKLHDYADRQTGDAFDKIHRHADKLQRIVDLGEDYVLVTARKAG